MYVLDLDNRLGEHRLGGSDNIRYKCCFCESVKGSKDTDYHLYLNPDKELFICFRCDTKGTLKFLCKKLRIPYEELEDNTTPWNKLSELLSDCPKQELEVKFPCELRYPVIGTIAYAYLMARGINENKIRQYNLMWGSYKRADRIFVPFYNELNQLEYWVARSFNSESKEVAKYVNPGVPNKPLFNFHKQDGKSSIVLVEGVFDAISVGANAVALLGKTVTKHQMDQLLSKDFPEYVISLDGDAAAYSEKIANALVSAGRVVSIVDMPEGLDPATDTNFADRIQKRCNINYLTRVSRLFT